MASNDVKIGLGRSTGMFYSAPADTALPTSFDTIPQAWESCGDVTDAGITLSMSKTVTNLRNWANEIRRSILPEHVETVQTPLMDTTEASLTATFGEDNVIAESGGGVTVNLSADDLPEPRAYMWIMKDGDDLIVLGTTKGQVTAVENVSFTPSGGITWTPTITMLNDLKLILS